MTTNATWWQPEIGLAFQYQLDGAINVTVPASVFDIDVGAVGTTATVAEVKAVDSSRRVICYVNVGSLETDGSRSDQSEFAASDLGSRYPGWPNEVFVDIRSSNVRSIMAARFSSMKEKACDAIEPDNMAFLYTQDTGFSVPITESDDIDYMKWISSQVHALGMAVGAKNGASVFDDYPDLQSLFDFAVVESCAAYDECESYDGFVQAGKPVYAVEYTDSGTSGGCGTTLSSVSSTCETLNSHNFEGIIKDCNLDQAVTFCNASFAAQPAVTGTEGSISATAAAATAATATTAKAVSKSGSIRKSVPWKETAAVGTGAALFAVSAGIIKAFRADLFGTGRPLGVQAALYAVTLPTTAAVVRTTLRYSLPSAPRDAKARHGVIVSLAFTGLAGVCLVWTPDVVYGGWRSGITKACAWLLWLNACVVATCLF
ncbi:hypothetical protein HDU84_009102 [Entophlyctis sp. JEL0112]|nr:hypothetical protein HDU84_009102 [Entophlyctis sp. JEL0112]